MINKVQIREKHMKCNRGSVGEQRKDKGKDEEGKSESFREGKRKEGKVQMPEKVKDSSTQ